MKNFIIGHTGCKVRKDIIDRNPHTADAGFAATLTRLNRNNVFVVLHSLNLGFFTNLKTHALKYKSSTSRHGPQGGLRIELPSSTIQSEIRNPASEMSHLPTSDLCVVLKKVDTIIRIFFSLCYFLSFVESVDKLKTHAAYLAEGVW